MKHKHLWNMSARLLRSSMEACVFHSECYLSRSWPWCSFLLTLCHVRAMVVLADNFPACHHIKRMETEPQYLKPTFKSTVCCTQAALNGTFCIFSLEWMRQLRAFYILYHIHIAGNSQDSLGDPIVGEVYSNISTVRSINIGTSIQF